MPTFSILTPTLNAERVLDECLSHLTKQNYQRENYEIIIADGGSIDKTLEIAKKYDAIVIPNPLKTGEAGKMVALRQAKGQFVVFLDSDNILIDPEWLNKMQMPFEDSEIIATEPIKFSCRPADHPFTRYFAYMGMGDPINLFLGNYDRNCAVTNRWTGMNIQTEIKEGYLKVHLIKGNIPTIGANGFVARREALTPILTSDYFFDVDVLNALMTTQNGMTSCYIAKVDTGLVHLFSGTLSTMVRKYQRKVRDYVYYNSINVRSHAESKNINPVLKLLYPGGINLIGLLLYLASCVTIIPLIFQAFIGFIRKPDWVWILHPVITEITCYVYVTERIKSFFSKSIYDRKKWSQ
jgi:glycosyltransferase involved in cell wall biosynthesis